EHPHLKSYTSDGYSQAILAIYEQEKPEAIVFGHTSLGKDLSPKVSSRIQSGLISDVTEIEGSGDDVLFIRPIYSGKAFEKVKIKEGIVFVTVRPNNVPALEKDESR
ncbi:electron transfer flavoprotein subunit alpha/FixB family protein, partial [Butyricicoccus sp. 1XD8-22]